MNTRPPLLALLTLFFAVQLFGQSINGRVVGEDGEGVAGALVIIESESLNTITDTLGEFGFGNLPTGQYEMSISSVGYQTVVRTVRLPKGDITLEIKMSISTQLLDPVQIGGQELTALGENWMSSVYGAGIYEAKKTQLIQLDDIVANKAANVSRQIYAKVPGLNIWESDGAGIQLGIGGRGLNPNRTSNFNVRQNGYDIAADALGYPESYYTPSIQALDRIEIVRGAAGLQYGTQFGGVVNFRFKEGPADKTVSVRSEQTLGSFGLFNSFNSFGGTAGKVNYYGFYQYKRSDGWRPNSGLEQNNVYGSVKYNFSPFVSWKLEYTHSSYLAQQPGGLTDNEFLQDPRQSKRTRNWFDVNWNMTASVFDIRISPSFKINNRTFFLLAHRFAVGNLGRIDRPDDLSAPRNLLKDNYANWGNELRAIWNYRLGGRPAVLLVGNRYYQGKTERSQGLGDASAEPNFDFLNPEQPQDSEFDFPSRNISFFVENIFNVTDKLSITPGIRYEYIITESDGYYFDRRSDLAGNIIFEEQISEQKSRDRSFALMGLGVSFKANTRLELYANFSQNFRAINFNDIRVNNPSLVVDENIDDESGFNADLGVRGNKEGVFRYDVSAFVLSYNERIGTILKTEPDPRFQGLINRAVRFRTNIADATIAGIEAYGEANLLKWLAPDLEEMSLTQFVNVALLHSRYRNSEANGVEGNDVELVPPLNLKTGLTWKWRDLGISTLFGYVTEHFSDASNAATLVPTAVEGLIPTYYVVDVSLSYRWKFLDAQTGINNLTNNHYFTRRAVGYPGPGIIPSDGQSFYFTLGVSF